MTGDLRQNSNFPTEYALFKGHIQIGQMCPFRLLAIMEQVFHCEKQGSQHLAHIALGLEIE